MKTFPLEKNPCTGRSEIWEKIVEILKEMSELKNSPVYVADRQLIIINIDSALSDRHIWQCQTI